jgi:hypothetical protein
MMWREGKIKMLESIFRVHKNTSFRRLPIQTMCSHMDRPFSACSSAESGCTRVYTGMSSSAFETSICMHFENQLAPTLLFPLKVQVLWKCRFGNPHDASHNLAEYYLIGGGFISLTGHGQPSPVTRRTLGSEIIPLRGTRSTTVCCDCC